jgi:hypothetical protein
MRSIILLLALAPLTASCVESTDEGDLGLETDEEALTGSWFTNDADCTPYLDTIDEAMETAAAYLANANFGECLENAIASYTEPYFPEIVIRQMRQSLRTEIACDDLPSGVLGQASLNIPNEKVTLDLQHLAQSTNEGITSTILHEVSHNKNYDHASAATSTDELDYDDAFEYEYTVTRQIQRCFNELYANDVTPDPNGGRRDGRPHETRLAPSGWSGGFAFERKCPTGQLGTGLKVNSGDLIDAIGLTCRIPGGSTLSETTLAGGPGGNPSTLRCGVGQVLIGVWGRAAEYNTWIGPVCAREADVRAGAVSSISELWGVGGSGGYEYHRRCPDGMAVRAIQGKVSQFVDKLEVSCQRLDDVETVSEVSLATVGGSGGTTTLEKCVGRAGMTGLTYQVGARVDRIGGMCERVTTTCTTAGCTDTIDDGEFLLPARGGHDGHVAQDQCPDHQVLVGLDVWSGTEIDAVRGYCAPDAAWSLGSATRTPMVKRGGSGGNLSQLRCLGGQMMVGWKVRHTDARVVGLTPICRNFVD